MWSLEGGFSVGCRPFQLFLVKSQCTLSNSHKYCPLHANTAVQQQRLSVERTVCVLWLGGDLAAVINNSIRARRPQSLQLHTLWWRNNFRSFYFFIFSFHFFLLFIFTFFPSLNTSVSLFQSDPPDLDPSREKSMLGSDRNSWPKIGPPLLLDDPPPSPDPLHFINVTHWAAKQVDIQLAAGFAGALRIKM